MLFRPKNAPNNRTCLFHNIVIYHFVVFMSIYEVSFYSLGYFFVTSSRGDDTSLKWEMGLMEMRSVKQMGFSLKIWRNYQVVIGF